MTDLYEKPTIHAAVRSVALGLVRRDLSNNAKFHADNLLDDALLHREEPATT